jgi:hypothetical protein
MKKSIIISLLIVFGFQLRSQILLENSYSMSNNNFKSTLSLIKLEVSGEKYLLYNIKSKQLKLYNLDHSVFKIINVPPIPRYSAGNFDSLISVAYLSEKLFNNDDLIEFVVFDDTFYPNIFNSTFASMAIFNEQGSNLFNGDSLMISTNGQRAPIGYGLLEADFIYNTVSGAKMILFSFKNNILSQNVYSLPGTLLCEQCGGPSGLINHNPNINLNNNPYPNPTNEKITIPFHFTNGENSGKIIIYDIYGKSIKEYNVDDTFDKLILDTHEFSAGTYFYNFITNNGVSYGKKIIVVK